MQVIDIKSANKCHLSDSFFVLKWLAEKFDTFLTLYIITQPHRYVKRILQRNIKMKKKEGFILILSKNSCHWVKKAEICDEKIMEKRSLLQKNQEFFVILLTDRFFGGKIKSVIDTIFLRKGVVGTKV